MLLTIDHPLPTTGTAGYWALVALNVPVLGYLTRLAGLHLLKRHQRLMIMGYEYAEGDVAWDGDKVNTTRTPARALARTLTLTLPLPLTLPR